MAISPTSTSSQSSSDQPPPASSTGAHRRYQVSNRTSERQPAVIENESVAKIPGFFERIANRFKNWKENRSQAAVNKSAETAGSDILNGLSNNNFKKVHQGLKRLHNAEQKFSDMSALNERNYIGRALEGVIDDLYHNKLQSKDGVRLILDDYYGERVELIDRYSDRKTLFHRMLTNLDKVGLISSSYVSSRTQRINDLDGRIKDSLELLKVLWKVKAGDTDAMVELGRRHYHGKGGVRQDQDKAIALWRTAADGGNTDAMAELVSVLEEKVKAGDTDAMVGLGRCYYAGLYSVRQDQDKAIALWRTAVDGGNTNAMADLGRCYYAGLYVRLDQDKAIALWQRAVDGGNTDAMVELGRYYYMGTGDLDRDEANAVVLWKRAVAAGNTDAMVELGRRHYHGKGGVRQDQDKAIALWRTAADGGNTDAMVELGRCYFYGRRGVRQDRDRAIALWRTAAARGNVEARNMLG